MKNKHNLSDIEKLYESIFENTKAATVIIEKDTTLSLVNKQFEKLSGYSKEEIEGKLRWVDFVLKEDLDNMLKQHNSRRKSGKEALTTYEFRFVDKNNNLRYIHLTVDIIKGTDKSVASLLDITESKKAELRVSKLNECLLTFGNDYKKNIDKLTALAGEFLGGVCALYNRLDDGMLCSIGMWKTPIDYNPKDKPYGHICYDVIKEAKSDIKIVNNLQESEYRITDPNVKPYHLQTYIGHVVKCSGKAIGSLCVVFQKDYSPSFDDKKILGILSSAIGHQEAQREVQQKLERSEEKFRALVENSPDIVMRFDRDHKHLYVNSIVEAVTGIPPKDFIGVTHEEMGFPKDLCKLWEECIEYVFVNNITYRTEFQLPNGRWIDWLLAPEQNSKGEVIAVVAVSRDVSDYKLSEKKLIESQERFKTLYNNTPGGSFIVGSDYKIKDVNQITCDITGYTKKELIGKSCELLCPKGPCTKECKIWEQKINSFHGLDTSIRCKDNTFSPILKNAQTIKLDGKTYVLETFQDTSDIKEAQQALKREKNYLQNILSNSIDAIIIVDEKAQITQVNKSACDLVGYSSLELESMKAFDLYDDRKQLNKMLKYLRKKDYVRDYEVNIKTKNGSKIVCAVSVTVLYDNGEKIGSVSVVRDLSHRKQVEEKLKSLSYKDTLTGVYNRNYFIEEMNKLEGSKRNLGIIICDLDGLKFVNDTLGHLQGDEIIRQTAKIISKSLRDHDIVARIGGDEFAILIDSTTKEVVQEVVGRIREEIKLYNLQNPELPLSLSIGYAIDSPFNLKSVNELYKEADTNMLTEKKTHQKSNKNQIFQALIKTMEARDNITEGHSDRLESMVKGFGVELGLSEDMRNNLQLLARFHDIGKVGIADSILFKKGKLSPEEFEEMKQHSEIGYRIAIAIADLAPIAGLIRRHHEKFNGTGYPLGLEGRDIPLECRIISILDAFVAMISNRPYRDAMDRIDAIDELEKCSGTQFDPELVAKFIDFIKKQNS